MKKVYPGTEEAKQQRKKTTIVENDAPDYIAGAPNYDKFSGMTAEEVLVWLNID